MTAQIIRPAAFRKGIPLRCIDHVDEAKAALELVRRSAEKVDGQAGELERLDRALDVLARENGGVL